MKDNLGTKFPNAISLRLTRKNNAPPNLLTPVLRHWASDISHDASRESCSMIPSCRSRGECVVLSCKMLVFSRSFVSNVTHPIH